MNLRIFVLHKPPIMVGGADRMVTEITKRFRDSGHKMTLIGRSSKDDGHLKVLLQSLHSLMFHDSDFDINVAHFPLYAALAIVLSKKPLVMEFHGPWSGEGLVEGVGRAKLLFRYFVEWFVYKYADLIVTRSDNFRELVHNQWAVPRSRILVVPGGVDTGTYRAIDGCRSGNGKLGDNRKTILAVRRLVKRTGVNNLIEAARILRARPLKWVVAGDGPQKPELKQLIHDYRLDEQVLLLGYVPEEELPSLYQAADLTVVPSIALEGFGLSILESLACGTPVIATPVGGAPEIIRKVNADFITRDATPEALADKIEEWDTGAIFTSEETCRSVASEYDWSRIAAEVIAKYEDVAHA